MKTTVSTWSDIFPAYSRGTGYLGTFKYCCYSCNGPLTMSAEKVLHRLNHHVRTKESHQEKIAQDQTRRKLEVYMNSDSYGLTDIANRSFPVIQQKHHVELVSTYIFYIDYINNHHQRMHQVHFHANCASITLSVIFKFVCACNVT